MTGYNQGQVPPAPQGPYANQQMPQGQPQQGSGLEFSISPALYPWLEEQNCSIAYTTYKNSRIFFLGRKPDGRLSIFERLFAHAMGLAASSERLYLASQYQIWKFDNVTAEKEQYKGYDRLYVPTVGHTTGNIDCHDVVVDKNGRVVFVNTQFSCLATFSDKYSFKPIWIPPFISKLKPEDRCHMNGLALRDGMPRYISAICRSDVHHGWRDRRENGGIVMDIETNEVLAENLSMPHSPRWHDGKLWVLQSGTGELGYIEDGKFQTVAFIPGYLRGLSFINGYAVVGLSQCRKERSFSGLQLDENLKAKDADARCGIHIIDLKTGDLHAWFEHKNIVEELYDVQILQGVVRPQALGFKKDDVARVITIEEMDSNERESVIVVPPRLPKGKPGQQGQAQGQQPQAGQQQMTPQQQQQMMRQRQMQQQQGGPQGGPVGPGARRPMPQQIPGGVQAIPGGFAQQPQAPQPQQSQQNPFTVEEVPQQVEPEKKN